MCLIKNLIAKRSNRDLHNPAVSPYPPNIFPFKRESEGETYYESIWDLSPKRESKRESKHGSKSKRESAIPEPYYYISQDVYTAHELFVGQPKIYWVSELLWREQEQTWWYQLKEGVRPDGPVIGWVAEAAMKAVETEGKGLC